MDRFNIYVDVESFGHNVYDSVVISVSAFIFDIEKMVSDKPYTCKDILNVKNFKLNLAEQKQDYNRKIDKDVLSFWQSQKDEMVLKSLKPNAQTDLTVTQFVNQFIMYCNTEPKLAKCYVNNKMIQPAFLDGLFKDTGKNLRSCQFGYDNFVDMQSFIYCNLFSDNYEFCPIEDTEFWAKIFRKNISDFDVLAGVLRIQNILRSMDGLENIKR